MEGYTTMILRAPALNTDNDFQTRYHLILQIYLKFAALLSTNMNSNFLEKSLQYLFGVRNSMGWQPYGNIFQQDKVTQI